MKSVHRVCMILRIVYLIVTLIMETRKHKAGPSHRELLLKAKQKQRDDLRISDALSDQLTNTLKTIVKINSINESQECLPLIDKVVTIHELSDEIDRQLNKDISVNYDKFLKAKKTLSRCVTVSKRGLTMSFECTESRVDLLQSRLEIINQKIRILEDTFKLLEDRRN